MTQTIKAIETRYSGYRFRSRLEARWAVFFNTLEIPFEYEKEGYELPHGWYLPDFWLPSPDNSSDGRWVEVKGQPIGPEELILAAELAGATGNTCFVLDQSIPPATVLSVKGREKDGDLDMAILPAVGLFAVMLKHRHPHVEALRNRVEAAFTAARSARFEHGERG